MPENEAVELIIGCAVECRQGDRREATFAASWGETMGDSRGVMRSLGSKFCGERRARSVTFEAGAGSFRSIGGGCSSGCDATIGAAKANGEEIDDGVEQRVW